MYFRNAGSAAIIRPCARQRSWNSSIDSEGFRFTRTVSCSIGSEPLEPVAGVDAEGLPGDRLAQVGGEEHDRARDLRRVGQVPETRLALEVRLLLLVRD